jgi:hydroxyacylglutathione hydrolase
MAIEVKMLTLGPVATNAFVVGDTESKKAVVIDPVDRADVLHQAAQDAGWTIEMILATHAHFDHVLASKALKELTGAPFVIHEAAVEWLNILPAQGLRFGMGEFPEAATPDRLLSDKSETIEVGAIKLETLFTPGHAPDHIAYYMRDAGVVFSGDCIFEMSVGRTDLPGSDPGVLRDSIVNVLLPLGDDVQILPGHGGTTTIARERRSNPFILNYLEAL